MNDKETPMMKQYKEIKESIHDTFLFFRCGDFYELFYSDALEASRILDITLTKRNDIPMCGVPYHAVDIYLSKMIKAGKKIAICEQMEDPKSAKGIVKREITQILTPGTIVEEKLLTNNSNNYLLAINKKGRFIEISYLDFSTGDFEINEIEFTQDLSLLKGEMTRVMPKEVIIPEEIWLNDKNIKQMLEEYENILINRFPTWYFQNNENNKELFNHLKINSWNDISINSYNTDLLTPAAVFRYAKDNAKGLLSHIRTIKFYDQNKTMILDETTIKNLELIKNLRDGSSIDTLLEVLDDTYTAMGSRLLKKWITQPLIDIDEILKRQNSVNYFFHNQTVLNNISKFIKNVMDLERLSARISMDKASPKDLISIKQSLINCVEIYNILKDINELSFLINNFKDLNDLIDIIEKTIKEDPSRLTNEGNIVKDGYLKELDELKDISLQSKKYIHGIEQSIKEKYNAQSLRIKYNKILGYFFELSKLQSKNLDDTFILRQSLVNTHRYTSKELSEYESKILTAREEINKIEERIFNETKDAVLNKIYEIQNNAKIISVIDVLSSFARAAINNYYIKPVVNNDLSIFIKNGRHPVVEQKTNLNEFIPNDLSLDNNKDYLLIITGPNMSGKSTYLRQNAIIVLLAQIGSFVPADEAAIGIVDRIFTRIGSSDNLARGQSTFLVEMMETANILKNATNKSLIIMDEIGRGTSTSDGLAIAWSVLEYIHNKKILGAKTLFATHFHELIALDKKEGIKNLSIAISEENENITFLHKIIEQPSENSYGIHVASLADLPEEVILFAEGLLKKMDKMDKKADNKSKISDLIENHQLSLFDFEMDNKKNKQIDLVNEIKNIDIDRLTPINALNYLLDIQKKINKMK